MTATISEENDIFTDCNKTYMALWQRSSDFSAGRKRVWQVCLIRALSLGNVTHALRYVVMPNR